MENNAFMKITYHDINGGGSKKISAYLPMKDVNNYVSLKSRVGSYLFEERKVTQQCELRFYWIDDDKDEIEIESMFDYQIFLSKAANDTTGRHLQVAPRNAAAPESQNANAGSTRPAENDNDPSVFIIHDNVECDGCKVTPMVGFRYKCIQCANFDLCQKCEAQHMHPEHMMLRMPHNNCPSAVDAWITAGVNTKRRHKRTSKNAGLCPFVANSCTFGGTMPAATAAGGGDADKDEASRPEHGYHHGHHSGRKHHRRQMRNGFFNQLYDIMQDLADGGATTAANTAAKADDAGANATAQTNDAAKAASDAALKAAEAAVNAANNAAVHAAACSTQAYDFLNFTCPAATEAKSASNADAAKEKTTTTNESASTSTNTMPTTSDNTTTEPQVNKSQQNNDTSIPVLNSPSLENLAQFVDPQYMKVGIQILNNFSEMFAKMLDPMDGADDSCPFQSTTAGANEQRKSSSASSTSNASVSSSNAFNTNATVKTTIEKPVEEIINEKQAENGTPKKDDQQSEKVSTPIAADTLIEIERERSHSEDSDWQMIEQQQTVTPNESFGEVSTSTSNGELNVAPAAEINFAQLSQDLKAHVEMEQQREVLAKQMKTANSATDAASSTTTATTIEQPARPKTPEETRAILVFHADQRINNAVHAMMAMGFSNEGAYLTQLLESVNGNIPEALDLMTAAQRSNN